MSAACSLRKMNRCYEEDLRSGILREFRKENCILDLEVLRGELRIWIGADVMTDMSEKAR